MTPAPISQKKEGNHHRNSRGFCLALVGILAPFGSKGGLIHAKQKKSVLGEEFPGNNNNMSRVNTYQTDGEQNPKQQIGKCESVNAKFSQHHARSKGKAQRHEIGWHTHDKDHDTRKLQGRVNVIIVQGIVTVPSDTIPSGHNLTLGYAKVFDRPRPRVNSEDLLLSKMPWFL